MPGNCLVTLFLQIFNFMEKKKKKLEILTSKSIESLFQFLTRLTTSAAPEHKEEKESLDTRMSSLVIVPLALFGIIKASTGDRPTEY